MFVVILDVLRLMECLSVVFRYYFVVVVVVDVHFLDNG